MVNKKIHPLKNPNPPNNMISEHFNPPRPKEMKEEIMFVESSEPETEEPKKEMKEVSKNEVMILNDMKNGFGLELCSSVFDAHQLSRLGLDVRNVVLTEGLNRKRKYIE